MREEFTRARRDIDSEDHSVGFVTPHSRKCRRTAAIEAWPAEHLEQALAWYHDGEHMIVLN